MEDSEDRTRGAISPRAVVERCRPSLPDRLHLQLLLLRRGVVELCRTSLPIRLHLRMQLLRRGDQPREDDPIAAVSATSANITDIPSPRPILPDLVAREAVGGSRGARSIGRRESRVCADEYPRDREDLAGSSADATELPSHMTPELVSFERIGGLTNDADGKLTAMMMLDGVAQEIGGEPS
eukprot:CAMPEP_0181126556 /NCGR_PEP_ID=MMETSP1071-20121207/27704_1 /TAXON_ID=35127 /ORGANISM="Thalassiosira sp., Strain NH16" /LENGTH=181 /DNA_ID=CAMNT_0023212189 /DNA_START=64 /DNA_END=608 /DNA_ORIENTATION=-